MKILIIGGGGREHALAWKLRQSPSVETLFCAPGNAGTAQIGVNVPLPITDHHGLLAFAQRERIDLTVVGPDDALAAGVVDVFQSAGLRIFGPTQSAARFESSKIFAKQFMQRHGIPTAAFGHFSDSRSAGIFCRTIKGRIVIKADGLALGKGVVIAEDHVEAESAIREMIEGAQFGAAGKNIVIEEFLDGEECSVHALVDGDNYLLFPAAQDHKKAFDGDLGPNTGGMGAFSPSPLFTEAMRERVEREILQPFVAGALAEGIDYRGVLYPGLMITRDGPQVLEFNCRFGDPETQVLLPRLKTDLLDLLEGTIDGRLDRCRPEWETRAAVCVVLASGGYPGAYETGEEIRFQPERFSSLADSELLLFHAGTRVENRGVVTAGGRVLGVTALANSVAAARDQAYAAVRSIDFARCHYRTDIALPAFTA